MASIPLLTDQDPELGNLPSYDDVTEGRNKSASSNNRRDSPKKLRAGGIFRTLDETCDANSVAFAHVSIRLGFLRKVLGILSFQFLLTLVVCVALYLTPNVRGFLQEQPWILFLTIIASFGMLISMFVYAHTVPINYFLLGGWTITQASMVGVIVASFNVEVVIQALLLTAVVVTGLFVYTLQSKRDFRKYHALLFTLLCIFLVGTCVQIILMSPMFNFMMSLFGAALFSVYLVFDIDMIMNHYSEEDYILACITIYLDIINLFIELLKILNEINRH